jgi:ABC-type multidrug transport system ATPase subunit
MLLAAKDVHKQFKRVQVLQGIDLQVERGEIVGLVGENGSGKSTLLRILVGLLPLDQGTVRLNGRYGYCPQEPLFFDGLTMEENIVYFGAGYDLARQQALKQGHDLMERLNCREYRGMPAGTLSGGTRQKLNLILALLHDPDLLLLDEPYQGFDYESYLHFWSLVSEMAALGRSALVVSHLVYDQSQLSRLYRLEGGKAYHA